MKKTTLLLTLTTVLISLPAFTQESSSELRIKRFSAIAKKYTVNEEKTFEFIGPNQVRTFNDLRDTSINSNLPQGLMSLGGDYGAGNGGDHCEMSIKNIRDNIKSWLKGDGPKGLNLPSNLTLNDYKSKMLSSINKGLVTCTDNTISVGDAKKVCKNFKIEDGQEVIICNRSSYLSMIEEDQYRLVHHEYAGLAGVEVNEGAGNHYEESNYKISNQISGFLEIKETSVLSINKCTPENMDDRRDRVVKIYVMNQINSNSKNVIKDRLNNLEPWEGNLSFLEDGFKMDHIKVVQLNSEYSYAADEYRFYSVFIQTPQSSRSITSGDRYIGNYARQSSIEFRCTLTAVSPCDMNVKIECKALRD